MRDLTYRVCARCGRHQGGKLHHFEGRLYCARCWREKLEWDEQRGIVVTAIQTAAVFGVSVTPDKSAAILKRKHLLHEARREADRAAFALRYDRMREFVRAFVNAMWALEEAG